MRLGTMGREDLGSELLTLTRRLTRQDTARSSEQGLKTVGTVLSAVRGQRKAWRVRRLPRATVYLPAPHRDRPLVILGTHMDTVPPMDADRRPSGTISGGKLYGRGALDMKAGLALSLSLLRHPPLQPWCDVGLAITTDEEGESAGAWSLTEVPWFRPDLILVPEPTWEHSAVSASGRRGWEVVFRSGGGHAEGALDRKGNPAHALVEFLSALPLDLSVTDMRSTGGGVVSLPTEARARFDQVFMDTADRATADSSLRRTLRAVQKHFPDCPASIGLEPRGTPWPDPYQVPLTDLVRRWLLATASDGNPPPTLHEHAVGDFNAYATIAPTIVFGPGGGGVHGTGEYVDLASLKRCFAVYRRFFETPHLPARTRAR